MSSHFQSSSMPPIATPCLPLPCPCEAFPCKPSQKPVWKQKPAKNSTGVSPTRSSPCRDQSACPTSHSIVTTKDGTAAKCAYIAGAMAADACFAARPSDIVVATLPKSGTTWMKSLLFATVHRREHRADAADHPFNSFGPHECIKFLEYQVYTGMKVRADDVDELPDPRLFATHVPSVALPAAVAASGCKIVYMCRDPKDTMVSLWHFANKLRVKEGLEPLSAEVAVELFCDGLSAFGPYWDHVLGYWRAHLAHPDQVLFFRYEEAWKDPPAHVRRLATFIGLPFDADKEENGVVDAIVKLCSFEHMGGLEVTKSGKTEFVVGAVENSSFFRRGGVGDWANYLSPESARRVDAITKAKFKGTGLSF